MTEKRCRSTQRAETPPQHIHDFSNLQGRKSSEFDPGAGGDPASVAWREALKLEIETRAARFHQAVDASIAPSTIGVIGGSATSSPTGGGSDLLTPRALILAVRAVCRRRSRPSQPVQPRPAVTTKAFWSGTGRRCSATCRKSSSRCACWRPGISDFSAVLRAANRCRNDQGARSEFARRLARHGVRFGAYYIYVPQLIKPAPGPWRFMVEPPGTRRRRARKPPGRCFRWRRPVVERRCRRPVDFEGRISRRGFRPCGERVCGSISSSAFGYDPGRVLVVLLVERRPLDGPPLSSVAI